MARAVDEHDRDEMAIPSYLHRNPAMRWMAWRRVEVVAERLERLLEGGGGSKTVLDYGCGTGVLLGEAAARADRVYGVDLVLEPAALLVESWGLDNVTLLRPEQVEAEIPAGSVDVVVAAEVLEHIEPPDEVLADFRRVLKPGGALLVSLPTENRLYRLGRRLAGFHGHYHHSNAATIDPRIQAAGFRRGKLSKIPAGGPFSIYWVADYAPVPDRPAA